MKAFRNGGIGLGVLAVALGVRAGSLGVPLRGQETPNGCWNAACQMVLHYHDASVSQQEIATWAVGGYDVANHLGPHAWGPFLAEGGKTNTAYVRLGCAQVLEQFGPVSSSWLGAALTRDDVRAEIDGGRPALLAVRWLDSGGRDVGGHVLVLDGYADGDLVSLNDPWPLRNGVRYLVDYDDLFAAGATYQGSALLGNRWAETLKTSRPLDLCLMVDTTNSMWDEIDALKGSVSNLLAGLVGRYDDLRVAVIDYRDQPGPPTSATNDWITQVRCPFTADTNVMLAAVASLQADGGMDREEAVFSAVAQAFAGTGIGAWREHAERRIVLVGDAPGHNPEPWVGGLAYADVLALWGGLTQKVAVHAVCVGPDTDTAGQFTALAGATGGTVGYALTPTNLVAALAEAMTGLDGPSRHPAGETRALKPAFAFVPPSESMGPPVTTVLVELQKLSTRNWVWKPYKKVKLPPGAAGWVPPATLPQGSYRWRLGYARTAGVFTLPSGETRPVRAATVMEPEWTAFTRDLVLPQQPSPLAPATTFVAAGAVETYRFTSAIHAEKYALEVWAFDPVKRVWKRWKRLTVTPPRADPGAAVLEVALKGHTPGVTYYWRVQSLNIDRPKAVWTGLGGSAD